MQSFHSQEKSLNLSLIYSWGDLSPCDSTEQLVNSTSKFVISISELSLGMKGALIFLLQTESQLRPANQGWFLMSATEAWPRRCAGSLVRNFLSKSCNLGENFIKEVLPQRDLGFCRQQLRITAFYFRCGRVEIRLPSNAASIPSTTNRHLFHGLSFL